ncbi:ABC transporter, partial [Neisseria meningitidis]
AAIDKHSYTRALHKKVRARQTGATPAEGTEDNIVIVEGSENAETPETEKTEKNDWISKGNTQEEAKKKAKNQKNN